MSLVRQNKNVMRRDVEGSIGSIHRMNARNWCIASR